MDCHEVKDKLLAYLEGDCTPEETKKIEQHIHGCEECKEELRDLQEVSQLLEVEKEKIAVPPNFLNDVEGKLAKKRRVKKLKVKPGAWIAGILLSFVFAGTVIAATDLNLFDWWEKMTDEQEQAIEENLEQGIGNRLNISEVSNDVEVTITDVVADDIQTLVYYEVEDLSKQANYQINYSEGVEIPNQDENWENSDTFYGTAISSHMTLFSDQDHVMKGRLGLAPIDVEEGTIQLSLNKIQEVQPMDTTSETKSQTVTPVEEETFINGEWNFEIPIEKHPAIIKELNIETEVAGITLVLNQLTIAPTMTKLSYSYDNNQPEQQISYLNFGSLKGEGKVYKQSPFSPSSSGSSNSSHSGEVNFESMYFSNPSSLQLELDSYSLMIEEPEQFPIDMEKESQTFEYLGTDITIDQISVGDPTTLRVTTELKKDRLYEALDFRIVGESSRGSSSQATGVIIDKQGNHYPVEEYLFRMNQLEQPRLFTTVHQVSLELDSETEDEVLPTHLSIDGYSQTKFLETSIEINLD